MKKKYWLIGSLSVAMAACLATACSAGLDPYDESKFGGSSNNESNELVTDKKIKLDGKLDDECWQNQKAFDFTYQNVRVKVRTVFGELGFYVGYEVEDDHVYAVEGRDVWKGSSVEMYVDRGDATKKSERTFQYRLGALDQWELLYGYETKEDSWSATYLPVFGRTQVQGAVNSGNTQGMTAEIYVRWDALGYDFTNENFEIPETVKIMPVYNQSSGVEMDSARDFWVNNGGDLGNPMHYWLFDKDGFADADRTEAVVGDSAYGRAKTAGWDVSRESEGIVRSKTAGDQSVFFTDIYATDYAVTTLIEYKDALEYWANNLYWQKDPYPKAGLILASDTTIQAYLLNYDGDHRFGTAEGMFFRKGNPDPRETWELYSPKTLESVLPNGAANKKIRLTGVKAGRYLLVFVGDENAPKYGGTFVGMQEIPETAGNAAPGFYTLGCEVEFTDYAATTDADTVTGLANGVLSVLKLDQKSGGALGAGQLGYKLGETATVTVNTYENYKLTSLKVNNVEKINSLSADGELTVEMTENEMTVTPVYERVNDTRVAEGTLHYVEKNAPSKNVGILVTGTAKNGGKVFLQLKPESVDSHNNAEWYANLPDGTYTARVLVDGIYRASKTFTVDGKNLALSVIEVPLNWVFTGDVETKKDGSVIVRGYNQYREVANRSAKDYFAMTALHYRDDGNFTVGGTWETGGFGVKIDNVVYRFHAMKLDANEMYLYIEVNDGASQEYRGIYHSVSGTGAPLTMDVFYMNGEFKFLFDGTTAFTVNQANTPNEALHKLFDTSKTKYLGLITVGKDMVFENVDFAFNEEGTKEMYNESMNGTVVLPQGQTGVSVTSSLTGSAQAGTQVTLTVMLESGYTLTAFTVNGVDLLESVRNNQITFTLLGGENVVTAQAALLDKFTVTGTFGYAEGLYSAGDKVNITSRGFTGTVNGENWSIELPEGTHEVRFESDRFLSKTIEVTVENGNVTVNEKVVFTQIKFEDTAPVQYENETSGDFKMAGGDWTATYFSGITAGKGIRVDANIQRADGKTLQYGDWQTGGLYLGTATKQFIVFVKSLENSTEIMFGETTVWGNWWWYTIPEGFGGGTGDKLDISFVYLPESLTVMIGGRKAVTITKDTVGTGEGTGSCTLGQYRDFYNEFFASDISAVKLGLRIAHSPSTDKGVFFRNVKYAPVTEIPADMKGSVKIPANVNGLKITAENGKLSGLLGEKVTLNFDLDDGKTITSLTLDGKNVLNELNGGKLVVTLKAGEQALLAETEGVSVFAVTGTLSYAEGLYSTGDKVEIYSGSFKGTLSGGNWTIKLPDGTHEITFASERFLSRKVSVQVSGAAYSVSEKVEFKQIKFENMDVIQYANDTDSDMKIVAGTWTATAFSGITAGTGIRIDSKMQRIDGKSYSYGDWQTGGFFIESPNHTYIVFVKSEREKASVYFGETKTAWCWWWQEIPFSFGGTGDALDLSLVYLPDSISVKLGDKTAFTVTAETVGKRENGGDCTLLALNEAYAELFGNISNNKVGLRLAHQPDGNGGENGVRFSNFKYAPVSSIPADMQTPTGTNIFNSDSGVAFDFAGNIVIAAGSGEKWLHADGNQSALLATGAGGDFAITYSIKRMDGNYGVEGTWETLGLALYADNQCYHIFLMRENASTAVIYVRNNSANTTFEYRIPYSYQGTGAPLTLSVAYRSADSSLHILVNNVHYALPVKSDEGNTLNGLFANNAKNIGFFANVAGYINDVSYTLDSGEVNAKITGWGSVSNPA